MGSSGRRWTVQDRYGNTIYLTQERWEHIIHAANHPEMEDYEEQIMLALKRGQRRQEPLNPRKYRYTDWFDDLPDGSNSIVVIVLFSCNVAEDGQMLPNNFVATAFLKHIRPK